MAEAAVVALTDTSLLDGITSPLTAAKTYTFAGVAELASEILGRKVVHEVVSDEEYRQVALRRGYPEPMVDMLVSMFHAIRDGEFNVVDPTLERILRRRPKKLKALLEPFLSQLNSHRKALITYLMK